MKFGIRECCDVVFRAKAPMKVGNKIFYKNEPVIYFDTLKTSTLEGAATTVYAQGGRGNARLMSWDGERTVTFTMEDALISPEGLAILTGAGLITASNKQGEEETIVVHCTDKREVNDTYTFTLDEPVSDHNNAAVYVMVLDGDDNLLCEPFSSASVANKVIATKGSKEISLTKSDVEAAVKAKNNDEEEAVKLIAKVLIDYYTDKHSNAMQISITPDKFGGAFYIEGSTLFREYPSQLDLPAEIIIPNGRVQSNFTFTMAGSGDPSTFTFTVDAFPDYTRFNQTTKVLADIQVIGTTGGADELTREATNTARVESQGIIVEKESVTPGEGTDPEDGGEEA